MALVVRRNVRIRHDSSVVLIQEAEEHLKEQDETLRGYIE
jgi:hypothetical protein